MVAIVPSLGERVAVTESLNLDLNKVIMWCDLRGMKLNALKAKAMIVSRSRTIHSSQPHALTLDGIVLNESSDYIGGDV